jgi:hypothetical protein
MELESEVRLSEEHLEYVRLHGTPWEIELAHFRLELAHRRLGMQQGNAASPTLRWYSVPVTNRLTGEVEVVQVAATSEVDAKKRAVTEQFRARRWRSVEASHAHEMCADPEGINQALGA